MAKQGYSRTNHGVIVNCTQSQQCYCLGGSLELGRHKKMRRGKSWKYVEKHSGNDTWKTHIPVTVQLYAAFHLICAEYKQQLHNKRNNKVGKYSG